MNEKPIPPADSPLPTQILARCRSEQEIRDHLDLANWWYWHNNPAAQQLLKWESVMRSAGV